jgi:hypothetical protein
VPDGSLTVVGTGIALGIHLTPQARAVLLTADQVFHLMSDPIGDEWIGQFNRNARSLRPHYAPGRERRNTYEAMVEEILSAVRGGRNVCVAFYGHPGVFAFPSHEAIRRARAEGFPARMLPGISAEDCLFADLGVDPGATGCQSYEATDFLLQRRAVDSSVALVLWQVGFIGITTAPTEPGRKGWHSLLLHLARYYAPHQETVLYEASPYPVGDPLIVRLPLRELSDLEPAGFATLFIPPRSVVDSCGDDAVRSAHGGKRQTIG